MKVAGSLALCQSTLLLSTFLSGCSANQSPSTSQKTTTSVSLPSSMVSITFDDGKSSVIQNAIPILDAAGLKSTQYIITGFLGTPGFIQTADVLKMQANGHEIGAHSRTHGDLRILSSDRLATETAGARQDLISVGVTPNQSFAYPSGWSNSTTEQFVSQAGFSMGRLAGGGLDPFGNQDLFALRCVDVTSSSTLNDVKGWISQAQNNHQWLILLFHDVDNTGSTFSVTPAMFQSIVDYLVATKITIVTMNQAFQVHSQSIGQTSQPPLASITMPNEDLVLTVGDSVAFQGSSDQPKDSALTYHWSFGDGSGVPDATADNLSAIQFKNPGVFTVYFTVSDSKGLSSTATRIVTVLPATESVIPNHNWKVTYTDSQQLTYEAAKAVDGTDRAWQTEWSPVSDPLPHEIQIKLDSMYDLTGFQYQPRQDSSWGRIGQYAFYVSSDGTNWHSPVAAGTFSTDDSNLQTVRFPKTSAKYIRFVALSSVSGRYVVVPELNVLGMPTKVGTTGAISSSTVTVK